MIRSWKILLCLFIIPVLTVGFFLMREDVFPLIDNTSNKDIPYRRYLILEKAGLKTEHRGEYATMTFKVRNMGRKVVTGFQGRLEIRHGHMAVGREYEVQSVTLQYAGTISPGSQDRFSVYFRLPPHPKSYDVVLTEVQVR